MEEKTALLPTVTGVRLVWAMTGLFSDDPLSTRMGTYAEETMKKIEDAAHTHPEKNKDRNYVLAALATMKAALRSLEVAYKGRKINFEENTKLREAYLKSIQDSLAFGTKFEDYIKALPAMTIGGAGGVTIAQMMGLSETMLWMIGLILAAGGYGVNRLLVVWCRQRTQMFYVEQDFERNLYYEQYLQRAKDVLYGLFVDLERLHNLQFKVSCEEDAGPRSVEAVVEGVLRGVHPTMCRFASKHRRERKITPELWAICESGNSECTRSCIHWEGE